MSSTQLLISRRALLQFKSKYPKHFSPPITTTKPPVETPWPKWMQMAGYTAAVMAVPYTIGVVITQSRLLIDQLEGEYDENNKSSIGRRIVSAVRWYWGIEDEIPYIDYLERQQLKIRGTISNNNGSNDSYEDDLFSLENEDKSIARKNQIAIERSAHSDVNVIVETDGVVNKEVLKGNMSLTDQLLSKESKYKESKGITVSFEDECTNLYDDGGDDESTILKTKSLTDDNDFNSSSVKEIMNMATIYDMWHYFPPAQELSTSSILAKSSSWMSPLEIRIEELQYNITELQKLLRDPNCSRDRDDMEREIKNMKNEIGILKREKRNAKLKKLISFS